MKKIIYSILFILSFFTFSNTLANETINENTIKKATLIEDYIQKHKLRIEDFIEKYDIKDISYLNENIKELDESIKALNKIKNSEISEEKSEEVIQAILKRIKDINDDLKEKLNAEKLSFEKRLKNKKDIYTNLGLKIAEKIDSINIKIAKNIFKDKKELTEQELEIKEHLVKLNKESKKLKYFGNIDFKSESEIKNSFVRILSNIKREVNLMDKSLR